MSSLGWLFLGAILAAGFFSALAWNTRRYLAGGPVVWAVLLDAGRWIALVGTFVGVAFVAGRALLPMTMGFALVHGAVCLIARTSGQHPAPSGAAPSPPRRRS